MGAIVQMIMQLVLGVVGAVASAVPGPMETKFRKDVKSERKALQDSPGTGFTTSQRQSYRAEALSGIDASKQQALAQLARGSTGDEGAAGQQQSAIRDLFKSAQGAENQAMGGIRNADIEEWRRRKLKNQQDMLIAAQMGAQRKAAALDKSYEGGAAMGQQAGSDQRSSVASGISTATSTLGS